MALVVGKEHIHDSSGYGSVSISSSTNLQGEISPAFPVCRYGAGLSSATNTSVGGLYDTKADDKLGTKLGKSNHQPITNQSTDKRSCIIIIILGLRQTYRWNYLGACAYVTSGAGICNSTSFGHAFVPLATILSDTPAKFTNQYVACQGIQKMGTRN